MDDAVGLPLTAMLAHVALGPLLALSSAASSLHAAVVVVVACVVIVRGRLDQIVRVAAYVALADVLWRATEARMFYEGAKYLAGGLLLVATVRFVRSISRGGLPIAYLAALAPSALLTLLALGPGGARSALSFNLSGPLCLASSALFFVHVRLSWSEFKGVLTAALLPLLALLSAVAFTTSRVADLKFGAESNYQTSGSFGPNQVSTVLCLGALLCLLMLLREPRWPARAVLMSFGLWFLGQGALTFSRGGLVNVALSVMVVIPILLFRSRDRGKVVVVMSIIVVAGMFGFARLDAFTEGALDARVSDTGTTGRGDIISSDLAIFRANPLAGVGPGMAASNRAGRLTGKAPHTEFTRLLAEHGALGAIALAALTAMILRALVRAPGSWSLAMTAGLTVWSLSSMANAAMRTAAVGFIFGLGLARLNGDQRAARSR